MFSVKRRIAELEIDKVYATPRPLTGAKRAVRAERILSNPGSPDHAKLVQFFERSSEGFADCAMKNPVLVATGQFLSFCLATNFVANY